MLDLESGNRAGLDHAATIGLAMDMKLPLPWLAFRVSADRTLAAELVTDELRTTSCGGEICRGSTGERVSTGVGVRRWALAADVVLQPGDGRWLVSPFVLGGVGWWGYDFSDEDRLPELRPTVGLHDDSDSALHLGGGLDVRVSGWTVRSEMSFHWGEHEDRIFAHERETSPSCPLCAQVIRFDNQEVQYSVGIRIPVR